MITQWLKEVTQTFYSRKPLQTLAPTTIWDKQLDDRIRDASREQLVGDLAANEEDVIALKAGLHLWNDSLIASHTLAQDVDNETGSYWHGIMHRMEPDYSNAKYWFRLTGTHSIFPSLQQKLVSYVQSNDDADTASPIWAGLKQMSEQSEWNPSFFIDLAEMAANHPNDPAVEALKQIQRYEMILLLEHTYERCGGGKLFE